jgi:NTE family protein
VSKARGVKTVNLALQGGGSHGAYTWGVLDALLDEERVAIEGISGASAGAMNAVMLAAGYAKGGREGAKAELARFWATISHCGSLSPVKRTPYDVLMGNMGLGQNASYLGMSALSQMLSPYQSNPLGFNPLRELLTELVDFKALAKCKQIKLFICATNVRTGKPRIFTDGKITAESLAASACLPHLFQAVKIGRDYYWDGGFMGNPPLWPLIYETEARDIIILQTSPQTRNNLPRMVNEIAERSSEISFGASLSHELRAIAFVSKLLKQGKLPKGKYKDMLLHRIMSEAILDRYDAASKMNTERDFLEELRQAGYKTATRWLKAHWAEVGKKSSLNVRDVYL